MSKLIDYFLMLLEGETTPREASKKLNLSKRQIQRYNRELGKKNKIEIIEEFADEESSVIIYHAKLKL